jgi:hypothetical protein
MKADDSIFFLVHSLNTSEKRFLKRFGNSIDEEENFLTLFSLIEQQKKYDENELRNQFRKKKTTDNFSWTKNYLTKQILRSLRAYHSGPWAILEVLDLLKSIEILYRKLQNKTCLKLIHKGIEICTQYEFWSYHLEFIDWEYKLMARTANYKEQAKCIVNGKKRKEKILQHLSLYNQMLEYIYRADIFINTFSKCTKKEIHAFTSETIPVVEKFLKKIPNSFRLREHLLWVKCSCYLLNIDDANELLYRSKMVDLYDEFPQFKNDIPFKYYAIRINYVYGLVRNGLWKKALEEISKVKTFIYGVHKAIKTDMRLSGESTIMRNETSCYLAIGKEEKALESALRYEKYKTQIRKNLRRLVFLTDHVFLARVYFRNGMYSECKTLLKEVFIEPDLKVSSPYSIHAHFLRICVNAIQGKWTVIPHFLTLAKKEIRKEGENDVYAEEFIDLIKKLLKANGKISDKKNFEEKIEKLEKLISLKNILYQDTQFFLREMLNEKYSAIQV